jgi:hypothetical protein
VTERGLDTRKADNEDGRRKERENRKPVDKPGG